MKFIWTQNALDDLRDLRSYLIENHSAAFAKKVTREIIAEVNSLKRWKNKGQFIPALENLHLSSHRQLLAGQQRIIFERGTNNTVYVQMIVHTSRDLEALLRHRLFNP